MEKIVEKKKRRTKEQVLADKAKALAKPAKVKPAVYSYGAPPVPLATKDVPLVAKQPEVKKTLWEKLCFWK